MNELTKTKTFVEIRIEQKPLFFKDENKVSFDTMIFIDFILSEDAQLKMLAEWKSKNTKFFVSTKVIDETFGNLLNKIPTPYLHDNVELRKKIDDVINKMNITKLQFKKELDNKEGFQLFERYEEKYGSPVDLDKHINDGRIVAHLKREGINVIYSREELVRKLTELAEIEARNFILDKFHQKSQ